MSSSLAAATTQGIPIPPDLIRSALESVAYPGYTGSMQVELMLPADIVQKVMVCVVRRQTKLMSKDEPANQRQVMPDPERKKPVEKVIADIKGLLYVRTVLLALEVNFVNGVPQDNYKILS
jgi:hypothetical protein